MYDSPLYFFATDFIFALYVMSKKINMNLLESIGLEIVRLRKLEGLSQEKLALNASIDRRYMSDIENGRRNVSVEMLAKIAKALDTKASAILAEAEKEKME